VTGVHSFKDISTDLSGSDETAINISKFCVHDDCGVSIHELKSIGAAWEM